MKHRDKRIRGLPALAFLFYAVTCSISSSYAQGKLPTTEQFMNTLSVCALDLRIELKGDIQGSVRSFYEGVKTQGNISNQTTSNFIGLFPASDRIAAYRLYTECVLKMISSADPPATPKSPTNVVSREDKVVKGNRASKENRVMSGTVRGPFEFVENTSMTGTILGDATVNDDINVDIYGTVTGDLIIRPRGSTTVYGVVSGAVRNLGGSIVVHGMVGQ